MAGRIALLEFNQLNGLFKSYSFWKAWSEHTKLEIKYDGLFQALFGYRTAGVQTPDTSLPEYKTIQDQIEKTTGECWDQFLEKSFFTPREGIKYLKALDAGRTQYSEKVKALFREAHKVNSHTVDTIGGHIEILSWIKLGSTVFVAAAGTVMSLGLAGAAAGGTMGVLGMGTVTAKGAAFATGLVYSTTLSVIKNWDEIDKADAIGIAGVAYSPGVAGIAGDVGKNLFYEVSQNVVEELEKDALGKVAKNEALAGKYARKVRDYENRLAKRLSRNARRTANGNLREARSQLETVRKTRAAEAVKGGIRHVAGKAICLISFADTVLEAWDDHQQEMQALKGHY